MINFKTIEDAEKYKVNRVMNIVEYDDTKRPSFVRILDKQSIYSQFITYEFVSND